MSGVQRSPQAGHFISRAKQVQYLPEAGRVSGGGPDVLGKANQLSGLPGIEPRFLDCPASSLLTTLTILTTTLPSQVLMIH